MVRSSLPLTLESTCFSDTTCKTEMSVKNILFTDSIPLVSSYTPKKYQKAFGFLMISGGIGRDQWYEMG